MIRASRIVAGILILGGVVLLISWWVVRRTLPTLDGSVAVTGLKEGVIVDRDHWGRPWIRAKSVDDLVTAQGYVVAQDRLWQMDLLRRAAAGELAEIFGPIALEYDKENRTLGMRVAAERAVVEATPEIRGLLEAYAGGVNQYISARRGRLPIEFTILGYEPKPWTPADTRLISLYMWKTLTSTWKSKLNREWITEKVGPDRARDLFVTDSPLDHYIVGSLVPPAKGAAGQVTRASVRPSAEMGDESPPVPLEWSAARSLLAQFEEESSEIIGSNSFVVSGAHTASSKPLLANDTHLALSLPCIWYLIHLTSPGWNVEGFTLPGSPLVSDGAARPQALQRLSARLDPDSRHSCAQHRIAAIDRRRHQPANRAVLSDLGIQIPRRARSGGVQANRSKPTASPPSSARSVRAFRIPICAGAASKPRSRWRSLITPRSWSSAPAKTACRSFSATSICRRHRSRRRNPGNRAPMIRQHRRKRHRALHRQLPADNPTAMDRQKAMRRPDRRAAMGRQHPARCRSPIFPWFLRPSRLPPPQARPSRRNRRPRSISRTSNLSLPRSTARCARDRRRATARENNRSKRRPAARWST